MKEIRRFDLLNIESPEFLKDLSIDELKQLCSDIREFIIDNVSVTGGHLSSNLGSIEIIVAMHYVFNSPIDKFLFDVSHQAYTHKILTGRAKDFKNLRQMGGLSGFTNYNESPHDVWEAGHSSQTISAAAGFLEAKEINDKIGEVVVLIGDGSIQNGLAFEGLNYIGSQKQQKLILLINDNEMSISPNVGRLAKSFSRMRIRKGYYNLKRITPRFVKNAMGRLISSMRSFVYGADFFSSMGYKYYGPIDGHNLKELIQFFKFAKNATSSVILHIRTTKGKGYAPAECDHDGIWHGVSPFNKESGEFINNKKEGYISWSEGISSIVSSVLEENDKVRLISPATLMGAELSSLQKKFPNKVIDVGINEEHAVVMAAAMSRCDMIPLVSIYSTFLQRAYDYINNDVTRSNNHVVFLIDRAGLVGGDGSTHQGIFDISYLSSLPNMIVSEPSNLKEARSLIEFAINNNSPIAIRYPKCLVKNDLDNDFDKIEEIKWQTIYPISEVNIITYGEYINELKEELKDKNVGLINALFIKPLDDELLKSLSGKKVIVVEEVIEGGSLGSMILIHNSKEDLNMHVKLMNISDSYPELGNRQELKRAFKIDKESILDEINKMKG